MAGRNLDIGRAAHPAGRCDLVGLLSDRQVFIKPRDSSSALFRQVGAISNGLAG
jgi:hypothetical protein